MSAKNQSPEERQLDEYITYLHDSLSTLMIFILFKKLGDGSVAKDIVYKVFLKIKLCKPVWTSREHAKNYFYRAVNNEYLTHVQKNQHLPISEVDLENYADTTDTRLEIFNGGTTTREHVEWMLSHVTRVDRRILTLFYLKGKSLSEIAAILRRPKSSIKAQKSAALIKLRKMFPKQTEELFLFILMSILV